MKRKLFIILAIICCALFSIYLIFFLENKLLVSKQNTLQIKKYEVTDTINNYSLPKTEGETDRSEFPFHVADTGSTARFNNYTEAVEFAAANKNSRVEFLGLSQPVVIWDSSYITSNGHIIDGIPLIKQTPELDRGCEVTALAMLINYHNIFADKMILAEEIEKDTTERKIINGKVHWGNPNNGFVGDMYTYNNHGLGVYHKPIYNLLKTYHDGAVDLTGCEFDDLYQLINENYPIWVIINTTFRPLEASSFETWVTGDGEIKITYREHAVVIKGFDDKYIYFNDPRNNIDRAEKDNFIKCWEQMGRQAVTIINL